LARASISLAVALLAQTGHAQAFGRFGYTDLPQAPGFQVDETGFKANLGGSDEFQFLRKLQIRRDNSSPEEANYHCRSYAGNPNAFKVNLREPGFEMSFPYGFDFTLRCLTAPFLTAGEATYGPDTPAAPAKWVLVTFSDRQPPVLLVFRGTPLETIVTGKSGDWHLKSVGLYNGWVKVCLPFGLKSMSANTVETLGGMAKEVAHREDLWTQEAPRLQAVTVESDPDSVTVKWSFDRAGALVPPALQRRAGTTS
jgi:hypothetical protein